MRPGGKILPNFLQGCRKVGNFAVGKGRRNGALLHSMIETVSFKPFSLRLARGLRRFDRPQVMGIVNATPDSFYDGSRTPDAPSIRRRVGALLEQGADWLDAGAYSSRPGADDVPAGLELERLRVALEAIRAEAGPDVPVSVDTFRASVAAEAVGSLGADIVNDISGGLLDPEMTGTVARLGVPYVAMHMRGTPDTMQGLTDYSAYGGDVAAGVAAELSGVLRRLSLAGVADVIVDPGFGFAKTTEQNYRLMACLSWLKRLTGGLPMLVGISRKSMIYRGLELPGGPADALPGTTALHMAALLQGADILRVHDAREAAQAVRLSAMLTQGATAYNTDK